MSDDSNQETLAELRRIRRLIVVLLVLIVICTIPAFYDGFSRGLADAAPSWEQVRAAMGRQQFRHALTMAQTLVARQADYDYGHTYLGYIYLSMDDVTNAEKQYLLAYELFPSRGNDKDLAAVRKRLRAGAVPELHSR